MIFDTFMFNNEFDMLEARMLELEGIPNLVHVAVEADVDHQDHPKRFLLQPRPRLHVVQATGLPTVAEAPDPWARENAQREHVWTGLRELDAKPDDVILHGDVDEIPRAVVVRNIRPSSLVALEQVGLFWSVHWRYPIPWRGTVCGRVGAVASMNQMRNARNHAPGLRNAGWHLSWLGGADKAMAKVGSFCHPEVEDRIRAGLATDEFLKRGVHVDGVQMERVEIDDTFPRYIREGLCPASWLV